VLLEKHEEDRRRLQEQLRAMSAAMEMRMRNDQFKAITEAIAELFQAFASAVLNNQEDSED